MPWFQRPDTRLYWQMKKRNKSSNTILMLHGLGSPPDLSFYTLGPELAKSYQLILPHLRGQGKNLQQGISDPVTEFSLEYPKKVVTDLSALLEREHPSEIIILGYSLGGSIGLAFAAQYPKAVKNLILLATGFYSNTEAILNMALKMSQPGHLENMPDSVEPWLRALIRYYQTRYQKMGEAEVLGIKHGIFDEWNETIRKMVPQVSSRTLIIHGAQDKIVPITEAEWLNEHLKTSSLRILDSATHGLQNDSLKTMHQIVEWIDEFLLV